MSSSRFKPPSQPENTTKRCDQIEAHPHDDGPYYYNLGTVLLKMGQRRKATAYLEKANRIQPHDIAIQQNLQLSRNCLTQSLGDKLDPASSWTETSRIIFELMKSAALLGWLALSSRSFGSAPILRPAVCAKRCSSLQDG